MADGTYFGCCIPLRRILQSVLLAAFLCCGQSYAVLPLKARILPLGDSITRGNNDINYPNGDIPGGYRKELGSLLAAGGFAFDFVGTLSDNAFAGMDPNHEGHPGFRTDEILTNLPDYLATQPDTVLLMVGTNDILQGRSVSIAASNLRALISGILENAPRRRLYVATIIPITQNWQGRPAAVLNANVDSYNAEVRNIVVDFRQQEKNVTLADIRNLIVFTGSTPAGNFFQPGDGVHPGQAGYDQMGRLWYQAITSGGTLLDVPAIPSGLTGTVISPSRIDLSWSDNANDEDSYQFRMRKLPGGDWGIPVDMAADTVCHRLTELATGANGYAFSVRAVNSYGPSGWSDEAVTAVPLDLAWSRPAESSTPHPECHGPECANDGNPDTHWISSSSSHPYWRVDLGQAYHLQSVSLTTRQDQDVGEQRRNFEIQASNDPEFANYKVLASRGSESLLHAATWDLPVVGNPLCRYVRIAKSEAETLSLAEVRVFGAQEIALPQPPSAVKLFVQGGATAVITWVPGSNTESGFKVERRTLGDYGYDVVGTASATSQEFVDPALKPHTRYFYRIVALNEAGESAPSAQVSVATGPASSFTSWSEAYPEFGALPESERQSSADPNKDGWSNLMAYAFGVDPLIQMPTAAMPSLERIPDSNPPQFSFRFRRQMVASDLQYDVVSFQMLNGEEWSLISQASARIAAVPGYPTMEEVWVPLDPTSGNGSFFSLKLTKVDSSD